MNIDRCVDVVCAKYGISRNWLLSKRKSMKVRLPRHVAYWLAAETSKEVISVIAEQFEKHESTVAYGIRMIEYYRNNDPAFREETNALVQSICCEKSEVINNLTQANLRVIG